MAPGKPFVLKPAAHSVQAALPGAAAKAPLAQGRHAVRAAACTVNDAVPAGQGVQAPLPTASEKVPAGQATQLVCAGALAKPGGQA